MFTFNGLDVRSDIDPLDSGAKLGVVSPRETKPAPKVSDFLMAQNRAYRRAFKRENGIFLHGLTRPVVNNMK